MTESEVELYLKSTCINCKVTGFHEMRGIYANQYQIHYRVNNYYARTIVCKKDLDDFIRKYKLKMLLNA